jgi:3-oxoacyl-(acyl-carrier-protein) synthase
MMQAALSRAGLEPESVGTSTRLTSTPLGDLAETR